MDIKACKDEIAKANTDRVGLTPHSSPSHLYTPVAVSDYQPFENQVQRMSEWDPKLEATF